MTDGALDTLNDRTLDERINTKKRILDAALAARDKLKHQIDRAEESAVLSAWRLGSLLIERKGRTEHGDWLPYLEKVGLTGRSASDYMRLGKIGSAADLGPSIRSTLLQVAPPPPTFGRVQEVEVDLEPLQVTVLAAATVDHGSVAVQVPRNPQSGRVLFVVAPYWYGGGACIEKDAHRAVSAGMVRPEGSRIVIINRETAAFAEINIPGHKAGNTQRTAEKRSAKVQEAVEAEAERIAR